MTEDFDFGFRISECGSKNFSESGLKWQKTEIGSGNSAFGKLRRGEVGNRTEDR